MALDPFHDFTVDVDGLPDEHCNDSVVRVIRKQTNISKPASLPAGNWDLWIITLPISTTVRMKNTVYDGNSATMGVCVQGSDNDYPGNFSTITAIAVPSGYGWYGDDVSAYASNLYNNNVTHGALDSSVIYPFVPARVIGGGYEVVNATPEMYKGGTVMVASSSNDEKFLSVNYWRQLTASTPGSVGAKVWRIPPSDQSSVAAVPGCRTWGANDGLYLPFALKLNDLNYSIGTKQPLVFNGGNGTRNSLVSDASVMSTGSMLPTSTTRDIGIEVQVACFQGLSDYASLTLKSLIVVETAPTALSSELALATPSAPYDPRILELYRNVLCESGLGCPQTDNPKGEWWAHIVKGIGSAMTLMAPLVSQVPTYGKPLGIAMSALAPMVEKRANVLLAASQQAKKAKEAKVKGKPPAGQGGSRGKKPGAKASRV